MPEASTEEEDGKHKAGKGEHAEDGVGVGAAVDVREEVDGGKYLAATVVRKHQSGELTVKYDESGLTEKYVDAKRVRARGSKATTPSGGSLVEGDRVLYKHPDASTGDDAKWKRGTIKLCRKDDQFDIVDKESQQVVKRVARDCIKKRTKSTKGDDSAGDDAPAGLNEGDSVEFKTKKGEWVPGRVKRCRKDGTFDVAHDSDSDQVERKLPRDRLRERSKIKSKKKSKKAVDDDDDEKDDSGDTGVRKRKKKAARKETENDDSEDEGNSDSKKSKKKSKAKDMAVVKTPATAQRLQLHQLVEFEDEDGKFRRGRIAELRPDEDTCDIEHESDDDAVSKRIPSSAVFPVTAMTRLWGSRMALNRQEFHAQARVMYRSTNGLERRGIVKKVMKEKNGTFYDVEDTADGSVTKKLPPSRLRPVTMFESMPKWSAPNMPFSWPSFPTALRQGARVRFRRRTGGSGRTEWQQGVLIKMKTDGMCVVEYMATDGSRTKEQVKQTDVEALGFGFGLGGMVDSFMPSLQFQPRRFPVGSAVEVSQGSSVYQATVSAFSEADNTYSVVYNDGRKETRIPADRVRLSLRKLRIGTEVEMIVEGPCKEVSKLDGEVAWVHRNEKVAIRINGGNNDVFAEVCSHALMVDGKPAFSAPLSSTWPELLGFYLNLILEAIVYLWFCFGMCVELGEMIGLARETSSDKMEDREYMSSLFALHNATATSRCLSPHVNGSGMTASSFIIPSDVLWTDRSWLIGLLVTKAVLTVMCAVVAARLIYSKIAALEDNFIDLKEYQQDRVRRRHLSRVMGATLVVCYFTLIVYASLLNRFVYYCLANGDMDGHLRFDELAMHVNVWSVHSNYTTPVELVTGLAAKTTFNLFRAVALYLVVFAFPTSFLKRLLSLLPAVAVTALVSAMTLAALHAFFYTQQQEMMIDNMLRLTTRIDWALVLVLVAVWFSVSLSRLLLAAGQYFESLFERQQSNRGDITEDVLDQAEKGEFGLQAKREVLLVKVEQRQEQLGVLRLTVLRIDRHLMLHMVTMVLGIIASCIIQRDDGDGRGHDHGDAGMNSKLLGPFTTFHLAMCSCWLVLTLLSAPYAVVLRREAPELMPYLLDI
ncbi:TPA: hypothetical protein N0F65_012637 [Lagenidium giganteum]|uniref:Uncharacterized protein n=1 Tax=Lagenidium giganteum TaxID=4803 RepID=A0AAV2YHP4_9STRA|nr:TPA: hypothetical protein N0F65_012637 [Lagenidium giganteum]